MARRAHVCLRSVRKRSHRANLEYPIPVARPPRFLSFQDAHANARGSFRGHDLQKLCICKNVLARFGIRAMFYSGAPGITRSPDNEKK